MRLGCRQPLLQRTPPLCPWLPSSERHFVCAPGCHLHMLWSHHVPVALFLRAQHCAFGPGCTLPHPAHHSAQHASPNRALLRLQAKPDAGSRPGAALKCPQQHCGPCNTMVSSSSLPSLSSWAAHAFLLSEWQWNGAEASTEARAGREIAAM